MNSPKNSPTSTQKISDDIDPFAIRNANDPFALAVPKVHIFRKHVCSTDDIGHESPGGRDPAQLVLDASEGFIPLWAKGVTLRWRFNELSVSRFQNPNAAKSAIEALMAGAILAWGDAAPIKFSKRDDAWDFEVVVRNADDCDQNGCTLAAAFFPDGGRHQLFIYPKMFAQSKSEQVETLAHEIGHIFGLRHFFANITETKWKSVIFGKHDPFSIMNYGDKSKLTSTDKSDLKVLYQKVWSGELTEINGTRVVLVKPFHDLLPRF